MITLTREAWKKFAPNCPPTWTEALFSNLDYITEKGILDSELRWCHFAATVLWEANGFKELRENLNYKTISALRSAWPSRFGHLSDAEYRTYLKNPRGLGNKVYNGRMGNRVGSNDGYDFRGGGWIQTTGRAAVEAYCKLLELEATSTTLDDPILTLKFAVLEWEQSKCNEWADANDIRKVAKAINTGSADSNVQPNGMSGRIDAFAKAWKLWGEYGVADSAPKKPMSKKVIASITAAGAGATKLLPDDPLGAAEGLLSTGERVRGVAGRTQELAGSTMGLPGWPYIAAACALGGAAYWLLCHYLPGKQG